jgi:hypothetical protein
MSQLRTKRGHFFNTSKNLRFEFWREKRGIFNARFKCFLYHL